MAHPARTEDRMAAGHQVCRARDPVGSLFLSSPAAASEPGP